MEDGKPGEGQLALLNVIDQVIVVHAPDGTQIDRSFFPKEVQLECIFMSDNIILSAPIDKNSKNYDGLIAVSIKAIQIAHQIMSLGLLLRGGFSVGNVLRYKNANGTVQNIFGSGYMNACAQEKEANNPRVVLHKTAADILEENPNIASYSIFMKEGDSWILDWLHPHPSYVGQEGDNTEIFNLYRKEIISSLYKLPLGGRRRSKWEWMAAYFNSAILYDGYGITINGVDPIDMGQQIYFPFKRGGFSKDAKEGNDWMKSYKQQSKTVRILPPESFGNRE